MAVPSQQALHRPILEIIKGTEKDVVSLQQIKSALIEHFSLDSNDLAEKVPSGQNRFTNRAYWAVSYLKRAGLLTAPSPAHFQITGAGRQILASQAGHIEIKQLKELINTGGQPPVPEEENGGETPDEKIAHLHRELEAKLADDLLDRVRNLEPDRFEQLTRRLLEKMGYGEGEVVGRSGDQGIDVIIHQDPLGLEKVYVQAKRWQSPVNEPEIRNFSGSLLAKGSTKGVFVTTSTFAPKARETARLISAGNQFIRLINGAELARLMIAHGVGVVVETTYEVKKVDENYFGGEP